MRDNGRVSNTLASHRIAGADHPGDVGTAYGKSRQPEVQRVSLIRFGEHAPQGSRVQAARRRPECVQPQSSRLLAIVTIRGSFVLQTVQTLQLLQTLHRFQTL